MDIPELIRSWLNADPSLADAVADCVMVNLHECAREELIREWRPDWGPIESVDPLTTDELWDLIAEDESFAPREIARELALRLDGFTFAELLRELALVSTV